ncbi:MAG: M23 family metallopeptidase [Eubacteriales bacterium]|nr:M23 family metallopeptidase [Eubacteriales bacterium]MDD4390528.1 M23 family metallopeptidase [Eubacteriales bacterium]
MRQDEKRKKDRTAVALALCFSVVAIASVFTVKSGLDKINLQNNDTEPIKHVTEQAVNKRIPTVDSTENKHDAGNELLYGSPLSGKIIKEFSVDTPTYSKTLDQYMIHPGIDIAAPLDTQVKAIADGTVTKVYQDDRYGTTIEITHTNGLISLYSNLSTDSLTEVGDVVKKGQVISGVGSSALFETLDESHLHFEIIKDGKQIDPRDYIKM